MIDAAGENRLTRAEIESMPAGDEMDRLIAQLLADPGVTWGPAFNPSETFEHAWQLVEILKRRHRFVSNNSPRNLLKDVGTYEIQVATDTELLVKIPVQQYFCCFEMPDGINARQGFADTMPLAICRAALATTISGEEW